MSVNSSLSSVLPVYLPINGYRKNLVFEDRITVHVNASTITVKQHGNLAISRPDKTANSIIATEGLGLHQKPQTL